MEEKLQLVLKEYIKEVEDACNILIRCTNRTENLKLKINMIFLLIGHVVKKWNLRQMELTIECMVKAV